MTLQEAIKIRHSVRRYIDKPIPTEIIEHLNTEIVECNREGSLNIQLLTEEPAAFKGFLANYGLLHGVHNYIAMVGPESPDTDERVGWYGERLVLLAQTLGLNTCWVGGSYSRKKVAAVINECEKLVCVIAIGYGVNQGRSHRSKKLESLCTVAGEMPAWFRSGMEAAMLAPTAINQQRFHFTLSSNAVSAQASAGPYSKVDLGIVKYHFEIGAGRENFKWR